MDHLEEQDLDTLTDTTGVPERDLRKAARMLAENHKIIWCWGYGTHPA